MNQTAKEQFLFELDRETPSARLLIERIPDGKLDWQPHPKAKSLGELAWHMASVPAVVSKIVQYPEQDRTQVPWPSHEPGTAALLQHFDRSIATAKLNLNLLSEDDLEGELRMYSGNQNLFRMPRGQFVRWGMITHFVHHRAQLGLYLRMLDLPVPALVGPSQDENPFAPKPSA